MNHTNRFIEELQQSCVDWDAVPEMPYIFKTIFKDKSFQLRLNDFPDEPICTIIIDDFELDLDEFPSIWTLPAHRKLST